MEKGKLIRRVLGIGLCAAWLIAPSGASAGNIHVTQLNDGYNDNNGVCSLREAISAAQGNGSFDNLACDAGNDDNADVIIIPSSNTIPLTREGIDDTNVNGDLDVIGFNPGDNTLTIRSSGAVRAGIDASALGDIVPANGDRALQTIGTAVGSALIDFRLENIEVTGGTAPAAGLRGAGIRLSGFTTATLDDVWVHHNTAGTTSWRVASTRSGRRRSTAAGSTTTARPPQAGSTSRRASITSSTGARSITTPPPRAPDPREAS